MTQTSIHALPYIAASQAQKHVTHNEALRLLDILIQLGVQGYLSPTPPGAPTVGDRHIVGTGGTGAWAGHDAQIAIYETTGWSFIAPMPGMSAIDLSDPRLIYFDGASWGPVPATMANSDFQNLTGIGVNATSDVTNRLTVSSAATLLNHDGAGHQVKINKSGAGDTGTLLYQTNWSGRAEMGLAGEDDWSLKVSADGSTWVTALRIDRNTGDLIGNAALRPGQYATGSRPSASVAGLGAMIYDSDLSQPVWSDGTNWRDASGSIV